MRGQLELLLQLHTILVRQSSPECYEVLQDASELVLEQTQENSERRQSDNEPNFLDRTSMNTNSNLF